MSKYIDFFASNIEQPKEIEVKISERLPAFRINPLKEEEMSAIRKVATKRRKAKNGSWDTWVDSDELNTSMVIKSVVFPDLHDAELQAAWGTVGAVGLLHKMLIAGEFAELAKRVSEACGYLEEEIDERIEEVKND